MPFAPHEIENKRFVVALRGYATDEVDGFLRAVAADYEALLRQAEEAKPDRLVAEIERLVGPARGEAQRAAERLLQAAREEAAEIVAAAEREAAELREAAAREAEACFAEIGRQAEQLRSLERGLRLRLHGLEHAVVEARQTLSHVDGLYPLAADAPLTRAA